MGTLPYLILFQIINQTYPHPSDWHAHLWNGIPPPFCERPVGVYGWYLQFLLLYADDTRPDSR